MKSPVLLMLFSVFACWPSYGCLVAVAGDRQEPPPTKVSAPSRAQRWQWQARGFPNAASTWGSVWCATYCIRCAFRAVSTMRCWDVTTEPAHVRGVIEQLDPDSSHSTVHLLVRMRVSQNSVPHSITRLIIIIFSIQWPCFENNPQLSDTARYQVS